MLWYSNGTDNNNNNNNNNIIIFILCPSLLARSHLLVVR